MARYIGKGMSRVVGVAKVTGKAKYAVEFKVANLAYEFLVMSTIAKGAIKSIDTGTGGDCVLRTRSRYQRGAHYESFSRAPIKQNRL